ncbi:MAG: VWA domain-containing protein [Thermoanaerobaculia bacterium]|nr:VWA domain-containing protein [Thermoanaerobaculia bacterium]
MRRLLPLLAAVSLLGATDPPFGVWIDRPLNGAAAFGPTEIVLAVESSESTAVEVFVDGRSVGTLYKPPYRLKVDLGYENLAHEIRAEARSRSGRTASAVVTTAPIQIDEEIELPLQQLYVTVSSGGRSVQGLTRGDFRVFDSGDLQEIVTFEGGDAPLTAVLLLDCSLSMAGARLQAALRGADLFLEHMAPLDEAAVLLFSDRLLLQTPFTTQPAQLSPSLREVEPVGGTALNDHLFLALKRLDARQGRRVVVAFTDGSDVHSVLRMWDVMRKAQISQAMVYWIYLQDSGDGQPRYTTAWRDVPTNRQEYELLHRLIEETGGRIRPVAALDDLDDAFIEILSELRDQYVLGYYPTSDRDDGSWHEVRVRVSGGGAVRTREGYLDY